MEDNRNIGQIFAENLKNARINRGYRTAKEYAKKININYTTYIGYETGKRMPALEQLVRLAKDLRVSVDRLLGVMVPSEDRVYDEMARINEALNGTGQSCSVAGWEWKTVIWDGNRRRIIDDETAGRINDNFIEVMQTIWAGEEEEMPTLEEMFEEQEVGDVPPLIPSGYIIKGPEFSVVVPIEDYFEDIDSERQKAENLFLRKFISEKVSRQFKCQQGDTELTMLICCAEALGLSAAGRIAWPARNYSEKKENLIQAVMAKYFLDIDCDLSPSGIFDVNGHPVIKELFSLKDNSGRTYADLSKECRQAIGFLRGNGDKERYESVEKVIYAYLDGGDVFGKPLWWGRWDVGGFSGLTVYEGLKQMYFIKILKEHDEYFGPDYIGILERVRGGVRYTDEDSYCIYEGTAYYFDGYGLLPGKPVAEKDVEKVSAAFEKANG